jgi:6-phosphogluconolactonase (cycloisomerase 2 family)
MDRYFEKDVTWGGSSSARDGRRGPFGPLAVLAASIGVALSFDAAAVGAGVDAAVDAGAGAGAAVPVSRMRADSPARADDSGGVIYAMTNASTGNEILVFVRDRKGRLQPVPGATASTGGAGGSITAGVDPLGSQGSLRYDAGSGLLFAVNAGDDTVAALGTGRFGLSLRLRALVPSGGFIPVSLAVSENHLYVLNAGGSGSVTTFVIGDDGDLTKVGSLDLDLPPSATTPPFDQIAAPGQVGVDALARRLIVTHAGGQELLVADLDDDGIPVGPLVSTTTPGQGTFSFGVTPYGTLLVAEAASASVSAFDPPAGHGPLVPTAEAVGTGQAATCWIIVNNNGFAYASNTGSNTLSLYHYSRTGRVELVEPIAAVAGEAPTDLTLADGGRFLYSLDAASGEISGFGVDMQTGALTPVETQGGLPASAGIQGIASREF